MHDFSLPTADRVDEPDMATQAPAPANERHGKAIATKGGYLRGWFSSGWPRTTLILGQASVFFTASAVEKEVAKLRRRGLRSEPVPVVVKVGGAT